MFRTAGTLLVVLGVLRFPVAADAQPAPSAPDTFTLENGLRVLVDSDPTVPSIAVSLWIHAGRAADPTAGGPAHLLEHLLAEESARYPAGTARHRIAEVGGTSDASSDLDRVAFVERVPATDLEVALDVQADRLRTPPVTEDVWQRTLRAVRQEMGAFASQPYWSEQLLADTAVTLSAAYRDGLAWATRIDELDTVSPDDVRAFHERWFTPDNAVLVVVGAVDPADARGRIEDAFGGLRGSVGTAPSLAVDSTTGGQRHLRASPAQNTTLLWVSYAVPEASHSDRHALALLGTLFSGGETGLLHRRLVEEQRLARSVVSALNLRVGPGSLIFGVALEPEIDADLAESLVVSILEAVAAEGVEPADLNRARTRHVAALTAARQSTVGRAEAFQRHALFLGDPAAAEEEIEGVLRVRELDLVRVSALFLTPERRTVVRVDPESRR